MPNIEIHNHNYINTGSGNFNASGGGQEQEPGGGPEMGIVALIIAGIVAAVVVFKIIAWALAAIAEACRAIMAALIEILPVLGLFALVGGVAVLAYRFRGKIKQAVKGPVSPPNEITLYPGQYTEMPPSALQGRKGALPEPENWPIEEIPQIKEYVERN